MLPRRRTTEGLLREAFAFTRRCVWNIPGARAKDCIRNSRFEGFLLTKSATYPILT
jgi:hypothetical protein